MGEKLKKFSLNKVKNINVLYIIRSEADFARIIPLGINGKKYFNQYFIFCGDLSFFFEDGIKSDFQKYLFLKEEFEIINYWEYNKICYFAKHILRYVDIYYNDFLKNKKLILKLSLSFLFRIIVRLFTKNAVNNALNNGWLTFVDKPMRRSLTSFLN